MSRLERDGKITIIFEKGRPEVIIEGDINGRMIKSLPRHLMAAYCKARPEAQRTGVQGEKKKEAKLDGRKSIVPGNGNKGRVPGESKPAGESK